MACLRRVSQGTGSFFILNLLLVALLWAGIALAAWQEPELLTAAWHWGDALPASGEILAWVPGLPWMVGPPVWQGIWPDLVRVGLVAGLALATVWAVYPHRIV